MLTRDPFGRASKLTRRETRSINAVLPNCMEYDPLR